MERLTLSKPRKPVDRKFYVVEGRFTTTQPESSAFVRGLVDFATDFQFEAEVLLNMNASRRMDRIRHVHISGVTVKPAHHAGNYDSILKLLFTCYAN